MTRLAKEALAQDSADFVFALDADELLKLETRATLERALSEVPAGAHAAMDWLGYVPDSFDGDPGTFGPGHLWWRLKTGRHGLFKVAVGRGLLEHPADAVVTGATPASRTRARPACDPIRIRAGMRSRWRIVRCAATPSSKLRLSSVISPSSQLHNRIIVFRGTGASCTLSFALARRCPRSACAKSPATTACR
jgi:hypothetical protein